MRGIFTIIIMSLVILTAGDVLAAGTNIKGSVKDAQTGDFLPGANIIIEGTSWGAATTTDGKYIIQNITPGSYKIRATYIGYQPEEFSINVKKGYTLEQDFELQPVSVKEKEIVVTAQASGQSAAINQQLSSDKIINVVSAAKIQALPDANAAESVGRLPGISLIREGGEGSQVVIRGLSPKYNEVTIDGVRIPGNVATNDPSSQYAGYGQSVDLSMISSSMLGGIEVTKAITPDMDAAVLGGVVNFNLREAKTNKGNPIFNLNAQGGYNQLRSSISNYKFVASGEQRFISDRLGIFAQASAERLNLGSNNFGGSYGKPGENDPIVLNSFNLHDVYRIRNRYGATVTMDYKIPDGKIDLMNFFSTSITNETNRGEGYSTASDTHTFSATDSKNNLNVITNILDFNKSFPFINVDARLSHSYSENKDPNDLYVNFIQNAVGIAADKRTNPRLIPALSQDISSQTFLANLENYNVFTGTREYTAALDFLKHFDFSDQITSALKFGGMYRYTTRTHDFNQSDGLLNQGSGTNLKAQIFNAYPWMAQPPYNVKPTATQIPITVFTDPNFSYGNFLNGQYNLTQPINVGMMWQVLNIAKKYGTEDVYGYDDWKSKTYDYSGNEYEAAGYGMYTLKIGQDLTILPGARYQLLHTSYTAPRGTENPPYSKQHYNATDTTTDESHGYWLPMMHLIYKPLSWLQLHLAYTNTLTYPDYRAIIPWIDINPAAKSVTWNNYALKPGKSANYDAVISIYNNDIGLFSVDGFLKHINDLIFSAQRYIINPSNYPGLPSSTKTSAIYLYFNDPYVVNLWGIEAEWQTHFWYLPDPFSGLVLSINYTHIFSGAKYLRATSVTDYTNPRHPVTTEVDTFYTNRLINQPDDIANLAIGYDYNSFSIRVSMIFKSNEFSGENYWPGLRANTAKYVRWDLSAKQELPWYNLQVYFDMNNINNENDISLNQGTGFPYSEQDYKLTMDLGMRWNL